MKLYKYLFLSLLFIFPSCDFPNPNTYPITTSKTVKVSYQDLFALNNPSQVKFLMSKEIDSSLFVSHYIIENKNKEYELDVFNLKKTANFDLRLLSNQNIDEYLNGTFSILKNHLFNYAFNFKIDFKKKTDGLDILSDGVIERSEKQGFYKVASNNLVFNLHHNSSFHIENHLNVEELSILIKVTSNKDNIKIYVITPIDPNNNMSDLLEILK